MNFLEHIAIHNIIWNIMGHNIAHRILGKQA
jgi:hypothetical protein